MLPVCSACACSTASSFVTATWYLILVCSTGRTVGLYYAAGAVDHGLDFLLLAQERLQLFFACRAALLRRERCIFSLRSAAARADPPVGPLLRDRVTQRRAACTPSESLRGGAGGSGPLFAPLLDWRAPSGVCW